MNCKDFNKSLIEYIETDCSGLLNHEMKEHMAVCKECCNLYNENLQLKASFEELFNMPSRNFTPQNNEILSKLDNKYYEKSLISKITYHFKRNKFTYAAGISFAALLIFALPVMKDYVSKPYNIGKITNKKQITADKPSSSADKKFIHTYSIKDGNFTSTLVEIGDPKKIKVGYSLQNLKADKTTSEIAKNHDALVAINGGATLIDEEGKEVCAGIAIHAGKIVYSNLKDDNSRQEVVGFNKNGVLVTGKHTLAEIKELDIQEGITLPIAIPLITNGKPAVLQSDLGVNPRTAIGQKADGTVLMLVIDGRRADCIGATLSEVQKIFIEHGAVNAVNLDGGSHSSMYYDGKIVNNPCGSSGERPVPSIFMAIFECQ